MQVHYDEGAANHIGPEPCADVREGVGEASVGERIGQPLSRESCIDPGAYAVDRGLCDHFGPNVTWNVDGFLERVCP